MQRYLKQCRLEVIILSIWIVILNYYKVFFHVVGVDTEEALVSFDSNLNWTLGSGRFSSALLRKLLMPYGFNYVMAMLITIIGWVSVCIFYQYCITKYGKMNRWCGLLFSMIFVSCPIWAEQSYFVCSVFVNVIGILLSVLIAYLLVEAFQDQFKWSHICLVISLIVITIGIYQAFLYLVMANCIVFLSLNSYMKRIKVTDYLKSGIKCVITIIIATLIYFVCSKFAISLFYDPLTDYAGYTDATLYVSSRIKWMDNDVLQCWRAIKGYFLKSISADNIYGCPIFMIMWSIIQFLFIIRLILKKDFRSLIMIIGNFLLFVSVYLGSFLLGDTITVREQTVLPFATAFMGAFLINELFQEILKLRVEKVRRYLVAIVGIFCVYGVMAWGNKQLLINQSDYIRYISDIAFADNVVREIDQRVGDYESQKIVFIGKNNWSLPENYYTGEVIGYSVLAWDYGGPVGVNYRVYGFMQSHGYMYEKPTIEEIQMIQNLDESLFGEEKVTLFDGFIVVNLDKF